MKTRARHRSVIVSCIVTFVILYVIFLNVPLNSVITAIGNVPIHLVSLSFLAHVSAYVFRSLVFYLFLKSEGIGFMELLSVHFIHNFYVHVVPANVGELSFPLLLKAKVGLKKSLAVLTVTRVSNCLIILPIFLFSAQGTVLPVSVTRWIYRTSLLGLSVVLLGMVCEKQIRSAVACSGKLWRPFHKAVELIDALKSELAKLNRPLFLLAVAGILFLGLAGLVLKNYMILLGLDIRLSLLQVLFAACFGIVGVLIPIKSIAGFGVVEGSWSIGLMVLGIPREQAILAGFTIHVYSLLNVTILFVCGLILRRWVGGRKDAQVETVNGTCQ